MKPRIVSTLVALTCVLAGCSNFDELSNPAPIGRSTPKTNYVALGDSFAAMGSKGTETSGFDECMRAADNYPTKLRERMGYTEGEDATCSGARTREILRPRPRETGDIPAQIQSLTRDTDVVTITIGANDIGFHLIAQCFMELSSENSSSNCVQNIDAKVETNMAALPAKLDEVYAQIKTRSPEAKIIATGYYPIISHTDHCGGLANASQEEVNWMASVFTNLNEVIETTAEQHGAMYVLPSNAHKHTVCASPDQQFISYSGDETNSYPLHPTPLGQVEMARAIAAVA